MKKKVQLILEFLAKCKHTSKEYQNVYDFILHELSNENLCARTIFSCEQIKTLLKGEINTQEKAEKFLHEHLVKKNEEFQNYLDKIFTTLLSANFPAHQEKLKSSLVEFEASLDKVEAKIYVMIKTYIKTLMLALELYIFFDDERLRELTQVVEFAKRVHENILKNLFYEEEVTLMDDALRQLLSVYVGVYYNFCYTDGD